MHRDMVNGLLDPLFAGDTGLMAGCKISCCLSSASQSVYRQTYDSNELWQLRCKGGFNIDQASSGPGSYTPPNAIRADFRSKFWVATCRQDHLLCLLCLCLAKRASFAVQKVTKAYQSKHSLHLLSGQASGMAMGKAQYI